MARASLPWKISVETLGHVAMILPLLVIVDPAAIELASVDRDARGSYEFVRRGCGLRLSANPFYAMDCHARVVRRG